MEVNFVKIKDYCTKNLRVFSVCLGQNEKTEFDKFYSRNDEFDATHIEEMDILYSTLEAFCFEGARRYKFVQETYSYYLPVVYNEIKDENIDDFGIRLYCIYLRDDLIILLNGDKKTKHKPEDCKNVKDHFKRAEKIGHKILKACEQGDLDLNKENPFEDYTIDI